MKNREIAIYGLYTAIFLIFGLVPNIGFIIIGPIQLTTIALPICIVAIHKGYKGALFGLFMFGLTSVISLPYRSPILLNFLGFPKAFITLFLGRLLIFIPLFLYLYVTKNKKINSYANGFIISLLISIFNTTIILSFLSLFGYKNKAFMAFFVLLGVTNIIPEWLIIPFLGSFLGRVGDVIKVREAKINDSLYY